MQIGPATDKLDLILLIFNIPAHQHAARVPSWLDPTTARPAFFPIGAPHDSWSRTYLHRDVIRWIFNTCSRPIQVPRL
jgi:hypothetical protein